MRIIDEFANKGFRTLVFGMKEMKKQNQYTLEEVESNLKYLGVTGLEDELQEDIQKCITDFKDAGIHVWMLTGDKGETAKEIGINCGLFQKENFQIYKIDESEKEGSLLESLISINNMKEKDFGFMIAGQELPKVFGNLQNSNLFLEIIRKATAVIVFRSSPS